MADDDEKKKLETAMADAAKLFPESFAEEITLTAGSAVVKKGYGDKTRTEFILDIAQRHESRIAFEAGWLGQRLTWLVLSQSFLFNAFANATALPRTGLHTTLTVIIPLVGLMQSWCAVRSIKAAQEVNEELLGFRGTLDHAIKHLGREIPALRQWEVLGEKRYGKLRGTFEHGRWSQRAIPWTLVFAWTIIGVAVVGWCLKRLLAFLCSELS